MWWVCRLSHHMPSSFLIWKENMKNAHLHIFHICKFAQLHIYTIAQLNIYTIAQIAGEKKQSRSSQQPSLPLSLDHPKLFCLSHSFIFGNQSSRACLTVRYPEVRNRKQTESGLNQSHSLILFVASLPPLLWIEYTGECPLIGSRLYFHLFLQFHFRFSLDFKITCCFQFLQQRKEAEKFLKIIIMDIAR